MVNNGARLALLSLWFLTGCAPAASAVWPEATPLADAGRPAEVTAALAITLIAPTVTPPAMTPPPQAATTVPDAPPTAAAPTATIAAPATMAAAVIMPTLSPTMTPPPWLTQEILGYSFNGHAIPVYRLGRGPIPLVFIGGIHGGYEWNTILLAYAVLDELIAHPDQLPPLVSLYIIPNANPDGLHRVSGQTERFTPADIVGDTAAGRFNGRYVDLNRNWDCNWSPQGLWRRQTVSGGSAPFSEPETQLLRDFLLSTRPAAVVFWHSAANGIFAGGCGDPWPPVVDLARQYGIAAGYPVYYDFYHYQVTGDASDWLALQGIPAISVELINHRDLDWRQNWAGVLALLAGYHVEPASFDGLYYEAR